MSIKLLPHQREVTEYLVARCNSQHGLIVNHYMGSGKTITGLTFLKNFPSKKYKKVIICPKGIEYVWISEAKNFDIDPKELTFINYAELANFEVYTSVLKNSICVIDEAHNLYKIIFDMTVDFLNKKDASLKNTKEKQTTEYKQKMAKEARDRARLANFIDVLYSTYKILLLTGTLVVKNNIFNIRWLINIAAGKRPPVVPFDYDTFVNKYTYISVTDKFFKNLIKPILKSNPLNLLPKEIHKDMTFDEDEDTFSFVYNFMSKQFIHRAVVEKLENKSLAAEQREAEKRGLLDKQRYVGIMNVAYKKYTDPKEVANIIFTTIMTKGLNLILLYVKENYVDIYSYDKFDVNKLKKDNIGRYFSYFHYINDNLKRDTSYPIVKEQLHRLKYTTKQMHLLIRMIGVPENLSSQELVDLEIFTDIREADLYASFYEPKSFFMTKGLFIGNLYEEPNKFKGIVDIYKKSKKQSTVVYSSFYDSGILLFAKYLDNQKISYKILDHSLNPIQKAELLAKFKSRKVTMLLLHPDLYEGVNILGCRDMHILEPIADRGRLTQLHSRVIRYKSHTHLSSSSQQVTIHQWACTLVYDINKVMHNKIYLKEWYNSITQVKPVSKIIEFFSEIFSADDIIIKKNLHNTNATKAFNDTIKQINISKTNVPVSCCIWSPDNSCKRLPKCET